MRKVVYILLGGTLLFIILSAVPQFSYSEPAYDPEDRGECVIKLYWNSSLTDIEVEDITLDFKRVSECKTIAKSYYRKGKEDNSKVWMTATVKVTFIVFKHTSRDTGWITTGDYPSEKNGWRISQRLPKKR